MSDNRNRHSGPLLAAEQAIARHGSLQAAINSSGLPVADLLRAWGHMDAAIRSEDTTSGPCCKHGEVPNCGTYAAYRRHVKRREPIDISCQSAAYIAGYGDPSKRLAAS